MSAKNWQVPAAWGVVAALIGWRWFRRPAEARLGPLLASLGGACGLAAALSAVQLMPCLSSLARAGVPPGSVHPRSTNTA